MSAPNTERTKRYGLLSKEAQDIAGGGASAGG